MNTPKRIAICLVNKYGADFAHELARQRVDRAIERRDDGWLYIWHRIALLIELSGRGVNWTEGPSDAVPSHSTFVREV